MNVDEALRRFAEDDDFPRDAMAWALANWETASARLIARLRAIAAGGEETEAADAQLFYILHFCGQMRETRAYEPLCRLIADDPDLEARIGDATTETLSGVLINVFDDDPEPLMAAIESAAGDEYARGAALSALGYLVRSKGALDDEAMGAYLRRLRREARPREIPGFWSCWAETAAALGYADLKMEVAVLTKDGLLDATDFGLDDFDRLVDLVRADLAGLAAFHDHKVRPFDDAIGTLETWGQDVEDDDDWGDDALAIGSDGVPDENPFERPFVNPFRNVGRNDPCPCGSGRKYKKCCPVS